MIDETDRLDRLAEQPGQAMAPAMLPDVMASVVEWLQPAMADPAEFVRVPDTPFFRPQGDDALADSTARGKAGQSGGALRAFTAYPVGSAHSSHVAAIILTQSGRVLDCNQRGESLLRSGNVLRNLEGMLCCADTSFQPHFNSALKQLADTGRTMNLLLRAAQQPDKRFSLSLTRMQWRPITGSGGDSSAVPSVLCLVAPLDGRRIATARQLMDLFRLSGAEARLARALSHGDSVEEYARDQNLRLPTVRTQLSSIFNKTGTERQATLVRLIAGIPVVRDSN